MQLHGHFCCETLAWGQVGMAVLLQGQGEEHGPGLAAVLKCVGTQHFNIYGYHKKGAGEHVTT